jgi:hypothetical protein
MLTRRLLLPFLLLPVAFGAGLAAQDLGFPYGDLKEITLRGKLVSLGDELSRKYGARVTGGAPQAQLALALPEGQYYTFLDQEAYRKLAAANLLGRAVEVKARHFPRSMILEVLEFKPAPAESIQRRFYCGVCDIYASDFGPCACCGAEMKVISDPKQGEPKQGR